MEILLSAYFDNNFGDDLMILKLLEEFPENNFHVVVRNESSQEAFLNKKNISFYANNLEIRGQEKFDAQVIIGGSMFSINSKADFYRQFSGEIRERKLLKSNALRAIIGCNIGPFNNGLSEYLIKWKLKKMDLITVRDEKSFDFIRNNKRISRVRHDKFSDVVCSYELEKYTNNKNEKILGISVYQYKSEKEKIYKYLSNVVISFLKIDSANKVKLFGFDIENENDLSAAYHIRNRIDLELYGDQIDIVAYLGDTDQFFSEISSCGKFISGRFHSAIIAVMLGIPCFPLPYSNKTSDYFASIDGNLKIFDVKKLLEKSEDDFTIELLDDKNYVDNISTDHLSARGHFKMLRELFEGKNNHE